MVKKAQRKGQREEVAVQGLYGGTAGLDLLGRMGSEEGKCWGLRDWPWKPRRSNLYEPPKRGWEQGARSCHCGHRLAGTWCGPKCTAWSFHAPLQLPHCTTASQGDSWALLGNPSPLREASESPSKHKAAEGDEGSQVSCGKDKALQSPAPMGGTTQHPPHSVTVLGRPHQH